MAVLNRIKKTHAEILASFRELLPKLKIHFSGKSPPEIFVGRVGYPHVNSGILAPFEDDKIADFSTSEKWSKNNFSISNILRVRSRLVYGRTNYHIKANPKLKKIAQELALSAKPVSTEIFLKKKPKINLNPDSITRPITSPAPLKKAILEENPKVPKKVDYLVSDEDVRASDAIKELFKNRITGEHIQKLLSIGMLGKKTNRRIVPTRWAITATDDIISKQLLEKIRYYPEINEILVFSGNFIGNYVEAILLPGRFSFEVLEIWQKGNFYAGEETRLIQDYEGFYPRKTYAKNVTGGYYAMRLPLAEYLEKIKKQATALLVREIRPDYSVPLGVGIVRETTRRALNSKPKKFEKIEDALNNIQQRLMINTRLIKENSWVLNNYRKQKTLKEFIF